MSAGYADKGIIYEIVGPKDLRDSAEFWKILTNLLYYELEKFGMTSRRVIRYVPFFRLANYTPEERPGMRKLHPHPGGELRKSFYTDITMKGPNTLRLRMGWKTPYLKYLLERGASREPGTTTAFVDKILAAGILRIKILQYMKKAAKMANFPNYRYLKILRKGTF